MTFVFRLQVWPILSLLSIMVRRVKIRSIITVRALVFWFLVERHIYLGLVGILFRVLGLRLENHILHFKYSFDPTSPLVKAF